MFQTSILTNENWILCLFSNEFREVIQSHQTNKCSLCSSCFMQWTRPGFHNRLILNIYFSEIASRLFESSAQNLVLTEGKEAYYMLSARLRHWCFLKAHISVPRSPPNISFSALVQSLRLMNLSCQVLWRFCHHITSIWLVANNLAIICTSAE